MGSARQAARRRAQNQVWTAAGRYDFSPGFLAFHRDGTPDGYLNAIVGFSHRVYDGAKILAWLDGLRRSAFADTLTDVAWLGIEASVARRVEAAGLAPALRGMQRVHARWYLRDLSDVDVSMQERMMATGIVQTLKAARCRTALGEKPGLRNPWDRSLFRALDLPPYATTEELLAALDAVLHRYFRWRFLIGERRAWHIALPAAVQALVRRLLPVQLVQDDAPTRQGGHGADEGVMGGAGKAGFRGRKHAEDWRSVFLEAGAPYFSEARRAEIEADICTGGHAEAHVYFARGAVTGVAERQAAAAFASSAEQRIGTARETNAAWAAAHGAVLRTARRALAARLKNTVDVLRQPLAVPAKAGRIAPARAWRALALQDGRIFRSVEEEHHAAFDVTLLLDASASRQEQQPRIAAEAQTVAESLGAAGIPVQAWSFASVRGVTVLTALKTFDARQTDGILSYAARGWNRDGLALRAVGAVLGLHGLGAHVPEDMGEAAHPVAEPSGRRHLVLMLTDAHPGDDLGLAQAAGLYERGYMGHAAVLDAAAGARALRKAGVHLIGLVESVFPGEETDGAAREIFGPHFVRVRAVEELAKKAGEILEREIARR